MVCRDHAGVGADGGSREVKHDEVAVRVHHLRRQLAAGDTDAALVLIRRFQSRVYGLAISIVRDHHVAEEVAQDAFVRAWRYSASYDPRRGSAAAWLLAIARNVALDHVRAKGRRPDLPGLESVDFLDLATVDDVETKLRAA